MGGPSTSLKEAVIFSVFVFSVISLFLFVQHEIHSKHNDFAANKPSKLDRSSYVKRMTDWLKEEENVLENSIRHAYGAVKDKEESEFGNDDGEKQALAAKEREEEMNVGGSGAAQADGRLSEITNSIESEKKVQTTKESVSQQSPATSQSQLIPAEPDFVTLKLKPGEKRGKLVCNGKQVDSEVIYWKIVPGDAEYESPITPHHENHEDRYLTFEYDQGGWNNVRMGMECLIVIAHAMGRTLVIPPQQHLYLLGQTHKDKEDKKAHDEMGFEDFFSMDMLESQKGYHVMHMEEFLAKEGVTGGLKGVLPPQNSTKAWGPKLWSYLDKVADSTPEWAGKFLAMPDKPGDFNLSGSYDPQVIKRLKEFGGERVPVFYDEQMQKAHHIHFPADGTHRLLQHHYAFTFFADRRMQSFYKRLVRDYMRYKDDIQCSGAELLAAVRAEARKLNPDGKGEFYALHIRRGDFQYKEVKVSAEQIVKNLVLPDGTHIIPPGSVVYMSTDDPDGVCLHCYAQRQPCENFKKGSKPVGCPEDPSWNAMKEFGWKLIFLKDFTARGLLKDVNPNLFGMLETIVCSKAKAFAGTFHSTFTGYIHRLRGYHDLGESTYYHTTGMLMNLRKKQSVGHGFSREWRMGWTDDQGGLI